MITVTIYTITNPFTGLVFYVGKTQDSIKQRLRQHVLNSDLWPRNKFRQTILDILNNGGTPIIEELESFTCDIEDMEAKANAENEEHFWIVQLKWMGFDLTNKSGNTDSFL